MSAYNPPLYLGIPNFNSLFYISANTNNYLTYPVSQQTDETFLGSVIINNNLTVAGNTQALNALSTITNSNNVYVTPTSTSTSYLIPLISSNTAGYKSLFVDSNTTLSYNPVTDLLISNSLQGTAQVKTNSYQGLTSSSNIIIGSTTNPLTINGKGIYNAILANIIPTITMNGFQDSIIKLVSGAGDCAYIGIDTANTSLNIEVDSGGSIDTINIGRNSTTLCNMGNLIATNQLYGTNRIGPSYFRNASLAADVANIDSSGNLFVNSISNFGATYTLKTINQTGYNAATTPANTAQNAITSNQAMTTNLVALISYTLQPGVWLFHYNAGFSILTGPCVITGYRFGIAITTSGTFDVNSLGNIQGHATSTYAALDKVQYSSSQVISLTVATNYTLYGTTIYSSGTFNFTSFFSVTRLS